MDDEEYYRKIREQYQHKEHRKTNTKFDFTKWNSRQGREDAELIEEKHNGTESAQPEEE